MAAIGLGLLASTAHSDEIRNPLVEVDLELVLAADQSASMTRLMLLKQRSGFSKAFRDQHLQRAIKSGPLGKIAVIYFDWSDQNNQKIVVPWTLLETTEEIERFADAINNAEIGRPNGETSIGAAMLFSQQLLDRNQYTSYRKTVDISGNGRNSEGPSVVDALRLLRSNGTTVNGLVLPENDYGKNESSLKEYFWREVVAGPGAFAITVEPEHGFSEAILRKLTLEVAWNR